MYNASSNDVMARVLGGFLMERYGVQFVAYDAYIHCLAHVVNLVVQDILSHLDEADNPDVCDYHQENKGQPSDGEALGEVKEFDAASKELADEIDKALTEDEDEDEGDGDKDKEEEDKIFEMGQEDIWNDMTPLQKVAFHPATFTSSRAYLT